MPITAPTVPAATLPRTEPCASLGGEVFVTRDAPHPRETVERRARRRLPAAGSELLPARLGFDRVDPGEQVGVLGSQFEVDLGERLRFHPLYGRRYPTNVKTD